MRKSSPAISQSKAPPPPLKSGCSPRREQYHVSLACSGPDNNSFCPVCSGKQEAMKVLSKKGKKKEKSGKCLALWESCCFSPLLRSVSILPGGCIHAHSQQRLLCYRAPFCAKSLRPVERHRTDGGKAAHKCTQRLKKQISV